MSSQALTLLDAATFSDSATMDRADWVDLGAYKELSIEFQLLKSGTVSSGAFSLIIEHAAIPQDDAFLAVTGGTLPLTGTAQPSFVHVTGFLRYVRWRVSGPDVSESAVVAVHIIAKD